MAPINKPRSVVASAFIAVALATGAPVTAEAKTTKPSAHKTVKKPAAKKAVKKDTEGMDRLIKKLSAPKK